MDFLATLNERQREAVTTTEGPLLILAGAGSGKTRVITYRIAYLILERRVAPQDILAVTFTNKAAGEMRERVEQLLKGQQLAAAPLISTFHSLCVRLLRRDIEALEEGYTRSFTIYDQDDATRVVRACVKDLGYDDSRLGARQTLSAISYAKNAGLDAELYAARVEYGDEKKTAIARVFRLYEERLRNNNALDFDDLLIKTVRLLRHSQTVRERYNERFKYILVDEYQDTNNLQFSLIRSLTEKQQNLCVVGDEDQCVVAGTLIETARGKIKAENVHVGDQLLCAKGSGLTAFYRVTHVARRRVINQTVVTIRTKKGYALTTTPEHIHFARYLIGGSTSDDIFFTYLMYKQDYGYRIGVTRRYRSYDATKTTIGFMQRTNQENADAVWVLEACRTEEAARYWENFYAATFGLPTITFKAVAGMKLEQTAVNRLFANLDTERGARALLASKNMSLEHPHHRPKCTVLRRRRNFSVTLCKSGHHNPVHNCEVYGSDSQDAELLRNAGLSVTLHKQAGWRVRLTSTDLARISELRDRVEQALGGVNLILKANFAKGSSFYFMPASHFQPGMSVFVHGASGIEHDEVIEVEHSTYSGKIFDFNVERAHNFVANGIFTHNSIYKFRSADITNILNFEQTYPDAKVIRLEQNYRSTQTILDAAGAVVKNNTERKGKTLWTANPQGSPIRYYQAFDAEAEARFVASKIEEHRRVDPTLRAAVLYRTNSQSRVFEEAMRRAGIAYNIVGGFSFYERAEVKDIIAYLKLALNPHDSVALMRVINTPTRGLGKQTLDELERRAKDFGVSHWEAISIITDAENPANVTGFTPRAINALRSFQKIITDLVSRAQKEPASEVVKAAILDSGYSTALKSENSEEAEARLENLQELVNAAVDYDAEEDGGLRAFIDSAALVSDVDQYERSAPVTLMTMHAAKGLEFPLVFIVGMEDGLFPHARAAGDRAELEEERRLCYVAITRAEKFLYVTHAMKRRVYGEELASEPSQFLNEMPLELMEDLSRGASWLSFARNSATPENRYAVRALSGEAQREKTYTGKTYDSVDSIAEFFRKRNEKFERPQQSNQTRAPFNSSHSASNSSAPKIIRRNDAPNSASSQKPNAANSGGVRGATKDLGAFPPGTHVRHPKYGRGLVLRREGTGDAAKLTVSFPGFGQKKLIEKYAGLEKA